MLLSHSSLCLIYLLSINAIQKKYRRILRKNIFQYSYYQTVKYGGLRMKVERLFVANVLLEAAFLYSHTILLPQLFYLSFP